jgi:hypothetical protein
MAELKVADAIESLLCAEINCDNVKRLGIPMVDIVKAQIQTAIRLLGGEPRSAPAMEEEA